MFSRPLCGWEIVLKVTQDVLTFPLWLGNRFEGNARIYVIFLDVPYKMISLKNFDQNKYSFKKAV